MLGQFRRALRWRSPNQPDRLPDDIRRNLDYKGTFDYLELAACCTTVNQFNRLHIDLENVLTPLEIAEIGMASNLPKASVAWLERLRSLCPEVFTAPQHFERRVLNAHVTGYESHDVSKGNKSLLLSFCGNAQRLMMPVSIFLQFVDCRKWDVVVVKKSKGTSYMDGLDGVGVNFTSTTDYLKAAIAPAQYRRLVTLGTSGGGFPAILAAISMGADRGISVGGSSPRSFVPDKALAQNERPKRDLRFVHGAGCISDRESAMSMAMQFGGRVHEVGEANQHNVLKPLLRRGLLADFLSAIIS